MQKIIILVLTMFLFAAEGVLGQKKEIRNVSSFSKLSFGVPGKLYLRQGSNEKVELEGDADVLEKVETVVSGSRLLIRSKDRWRTWNWGSNRITAYVTMKNIEGIDVSGSGDVIGEGVFQSSELELRVSGSGNLSLEANATGHTEADVSGSGAIDLKGKCRSFDSDVSGSGKVRMNLTVANNASFGISGSGKIEASGSAQNARIAISGSGKVLGRDFETKVCNVKIAGSGDVEIAVEKELDANISGSGSVLYRGNPDRLNSHSGGSGKVRKM